MSAPTITWLGWMETVPGRASIEQWNVSYGDGRREDTLRRRSLEALGYTVPPAPVPDPALQTASS
jgi:hypothetical protein